MQSITNRKDDFLKKLDIYLLETENERSGGFGSTGVSFYNKLSNYIEKESPKNFKEEMLKHIDEYKNRTGNNEVDLYKKAQVDRRSYSRFLITGTLPKNDIICYCVALELNEKETKELLSLAGHSLGDSKFDRIIEFCIKEKCYDIDDINEALFHYNQKLLGVQRNI